MHRNKCRFRSERVSFCQRNGCRFGSEYALKHFMRGRTGPVFLVLDGHPAHIAKAVAHYVQSLKGRLELHFLPGYAPELNPDEFVWNHLKGQGVSKKPLRRDESASQSRSNRPGRYQIAPRSCPLVFSCA